ncbi:type II secretion system protein, partial [Streptomyces sp. SID11233]|nr:type II secretion system protein [Streptomyces sp. SID11233]
MNHDFAEAYHDTPAAGHQLAAGLDAFGDFGGLLSPSVLGALGAGLLAGGGCALLVVALYGL